MTPVRVVSTELTFTRCSGQHWPLPKSLLPDFLTPVWCRTLTRAGRASTWVRPWLAGPANPSTTMGSWWRCTIPRSRKDLRRSRGTGGGMWGSVAPFTQTRTRGHRPDPCWWPTATTVRAPPSCIRTERSGRHGKGKSSAGSSSSAQTAGGTLSTWTSATWAGTSGSWRRQATMLSTAMASVPSHCRTTWTPPITPSSRRWWTQSIPIFPELAASRRNSVPYRCCTWTSTRKSFLKTTRTWWWRAAGADESYISPMKTFIYTKERSKSYFGGRKEIQYIWIYLCWLKKMENKYFNESACFFQWLLRCFFPVPCTFQNECNCTWSIMLRFLWCIYCITTLFVNDVYLSWKNIWSSFSVHLGIHSLKPKNKPWMKFSLKVMI